MAELTEIIRENYGMISYQMRQFFLEMIKQRKLRAYTVAVNKRTVEKDTENEEVVRIRKGAILTPTTELREDQAVLIEDPKTGTMYNLDIGSRGGMFYNDGDSQTIYHHCILEKLAEQFDLRKVATFGSYRISIPGEMVTARLRVSYDEDWESGGESDYVAGTRGYLVIEGEQDNFFKEVCDFIGGKNGSRFRKKD